MRRAVPLVLLMMVHHASAAVVGYYSVPDYSVPDYTVPEYRDAAEGGRRADEIAEYVADPEKAMRRLNERGEVLGDRALDRALDRAQIAHDEARGIVDRAVVAASMDRRLPLDEEAVERAMERAVEAASDARAIHQEKYEDIYEQFRRQQVLERRKWFVPLAMGCLVGAVFGAIIAVAKHSCRAATAVVVLLWCLAFAAVVSTYSRGV